MTIIDEPLDIEEDWPRAIPREQARLMLESWVERGIISLAYAQDFWDDVLAPLYDSRAAASRFPRGRCVCGAQHPAWRLPNYSGRRTEHRMSCRHYVGPLTHRRSQALNGGYSITGTPMAYCTCGKRYPYWADEAETQPSVCPDILFVWRGERPDTQEDAVSEQDERKSNAEVQEEYGVASDSQVAVQAEQERLEALAAKGQVGPDTSKAEETDEQSDTEDEDHEPNDDETADKADADDEEGKEGQSFHQ